MLRYGAYSQLYFKYKTDDLAADKEYIDLIVDPKEDAAKFTTAYSEDGSIEGLEFVGANLTLESSITLRLFYKHSADMNLEDVQFTTNATGTTVKTGENGETYYYVEIANITADKIGEKIEVVATSGSETLTVNYSVSDYCKNVISREITETRPESLKNLVMALYNFSEAAKAYQSK